jgi:hypothetical protein
MHLESIFAQDGNWFVPDPKSIVGQADRRLMLWIAVVTSGKQSQKKQTRQLAWLRGTMNIAALTMDVDLFQGLVCLYASWWHVLETWASWHW